MLATLQRMTPCRLVAKFRLFNPSPVRNPMGVSYVAHSRNFRQANPNPHLHKKGRTKMESVALSCGLWNARVPARQVTGRSFHVIGYVGQLHLNVSRHPERPSPDCPIS